MWTPSETSNRLQISVNLTNLTSFGSKLMFFPQIHVKSFPFALTKFILLFKYFVKIYDLLSIYVGSWFDGFFCWKILSSMLTLWKNEKFSLTKFFLSNQLFSNLFSKSATFTKFLPKIRDREFPLIPQCNLLFTLREINTSLQITKGTIVRKKY